MTEESKKAEIIAISLPLTKRELIAVMLLAGLNANPRSKTSTTDYLRKLAILQADEFIEAIYQEDLSNAVDTVLSEMEHD